MFLRVLGCSRMFLHVLECSRMFLRVFFLACSRMLLDLSYNMVLSLAIHSLMQ